MIAAGPKPHKKLLTRARPEHSQALRRSLQLFFLALNIWIGIQFYLFVRYYETGGRSVFVPRPPGVEGWLPIASLMNLKVLLSGRGVSKIHPAGTFLLIAFLVASWIFRKSFCSWLCPVGTISEYLWRFGRKIFRRNFYLTQVVDVPLRGLKYVLLAAFLYAVVSMPVAAIQGFLNSPYGIVDDVKMLNFFREIAFTGIGVLSILAVGSVAVQNFWCRYFCPYGALMSLAALLSPLRIRREPEICIDCAKCAKACPSALPVDRLVTIHSADCTGCLQCVAACPAEGALFYSAPRRKRVPAWVVAAGIAALFLSICAYAQWTGHWHTDLSGRVYFNLIPRADEFEH
ncbi:MAG TPA: 4Fe-4S binding protein [Bryobacteraceae bacterium]|nr:4Fe-4S binding protein [Bryobacteraceae bacterium]